MYLKVERDLPVAEIQAARSFEACLLALILHRTSMQDEALLL